jgi:hypothetical protein
VLPDYWLYKPHHDLAEEAGFETLLEAADGAELEYTLPHPKWQFLCFAAERLGLALHGTDNPNIEEFEPRQANDVREFGAQKAVYAASDGLWPMYFAILKPEAETTRMNACITHQGQRRYFFSIDGRALQREPWQEGWVYILPGETFTKEPPANFNGIDIQVEQMASPIHVKPLARIRVQQEDFPFLHQVRAHDESNLMEYVEALQTGGPWPTSDASALPDD